MGAELVKRELEAFLRTQSPQACLDNVDDVLLNYIADVLCDLGEGAEGENSFDVEEFSEMISAYVPEFAAVQSSAVCVWVFEMVDKQRQKNRAGKDKVEEFSTSQCTPQTSKEREHVIKTLEREREHSKEKCASDGNISGLFDTQPSSSDDGDCGSDAENISLLKEMFPDVAARHLSAALVKCGGNLDLTIQRLLAAGKQEKGSEMKRKKEYQKMEMCDDEDLKASVLARYAYVDTDDDKVTHQPVLVKEEQKKMVRYRDGQVVSTKGERYTLLTRKDTEGQEMKTTYINLKPLRKYRFH